MNDQETDRSLHCPNCGAEVHGEYCHRCGQKQEEYVSSLKHILHQFLEDYFTFDSRFFRSIGPLFAKPGYLVNEYLDGRRQSFIRPLRMYLFASLIFFFVLSIGAEFRLFGGGAEERERSAARVDSVFTAVRDSLRNSTLDSSERALVEGIFRATRDTGFAGNEYDTEGDTGEGTFNLEQAEGDTTGQVHDVTFNFRGKTYHYRLNEATFERDFINNMPKMMFILLPIFALLLKILYIRRDRLYVEHLVFALYYHAFVFLLFSAVTLIGSGWLQMIAFWGVVVYLFLAMLRVYRQSIFKTLLKFGGLLMIYGLTLAAALLGNIVVTVVI